MSDLPAGWLRTELGAVASFEMGQAPPGSASNFEGRGTPFVKAGEFGRRSPVIREWTTEPKKLARAGDVLICVVGATAGKLNLGAECAIGRSVAAIRPATALLQQCLYYQLLLQVQRLRAASSGSAQGVISKEMLAGISLLLPPLAEQQRIANKLDALLTRVDACRDRLDRVPAILKRFRQAVLGAATTGALTADFRGAAPQGSGDDLPDGWRMVTFEDVCTEITVGYVGKMSDQYRPAGVPFLRSMNVRALRFEPKGLLYVAEAFHRQIGKSSLRPGDLAIVRTGAPGVCCVIPQDLPEANCSDLVIARPGKELVSGYGCIVMNSSFASDFVRANQVGVAQAHFNVGSMKIAPLPLPPVEEQVEIVRRVESLFALADAIEAKWQTALAQVERLTPALLAKAFRGELVPQDPNDEPAAERLKRLAQDRTDALAKPRKTRKRQLA